MKIGKTELENILYGACFLASGGGGPLDLGQSCIDANFADDDFVEVVSCDTIDNKDWIVPSAGMGLPSASFNPNELNRSVFNVIEIMEHWCRTNKSDFSDFKYILPMEVGTVNSILPIIACKLAKDLGRELKVIDADPSGRATPVLPLTLLAGNNVPFYPNFIASGNTKPYFSSYNLESLDHVQECFGQMFTSSAFKNSGGFSLYPTSKKNLKDEYIVQNTMTDALNLGKIIKTSDTITQRIEQVINYMNNTSKEKRYTKKIFYGTLANIETTVVNGTDVGVLAIMSEDNMLFKAYTENENIYANIITDTRKNEQKEEPFIMGPDSICYLPEIIYHTENSSNQDIVVTDVTELSILFKDKNVKTINLYVIAIDAPKDVQNCKGLIENWETLNKSLGGEDKYTQPWKK